MCFIGNNLNSISNYRHTSFKKRKSSNNAFRQTCRYGCSSSLHRIYVAFLLSRHGGEMWQFIHNFIMFCWRITTTWLGMYRITIEKFKGDSCCETVIKDREMVTITLAYFGRREIAFSRARPRLRRHGVNGAENFNNTESHSQ